MEKSIHPTPVTRGPAAGAWLSCALAPLLFGAPADALAQATEAPWTHEVQQLARGAAPRPGTRVEVEVGSLDPRLKLAPCERITPYVPSGARLWGRTRVGLRCDQGARWNVYLPVTVKVFAEAWIATQALQPGAVLEAAHLQRAEVDLAAAASPAIREPAQAVGRTLARALRPGQAVRQADLKARQWFAAGDTVRVVTVGRGFSVVADGKALGPGIDGQAARVRIDSGRVVSGRAVAQHRVEVLL